MLAPSGASRTTILVILAGFRAPTNGSILVAGRSIENMPPHKHDIGLLFQNCALFPHMTPLTTKLALCTQGAQAWQGRDGGQDQTGARHGPSALTANAGPTGFPAAVAARRAMG
nr:MULTISPECIES: ATP-binding cassette domain-containing protein [unclassified Bradyrhizobium]